MNVRATSSCYGPDICGNLADDGPGQISIRLTTKPVSRNFIITAFFIVTACLLWSAPILADHGGTSGGVCMADRYNGDRNAIGDGLNPPQPGAPNDTLGCSSNDVELAVYHLAEGPNFCLDGETIAVRLRGEFESGSDERYDVGLFIAEDGGDANTTGGTCWSDYLHPASSDNSDLDLSGGAGPFFNAEIAEDNGDACGDIEQSNPASFETGWISIACQDANTDGIADVASCTVWANSKSNGSDKPSCESELDVTADTTSKCTCDDVNIIGIAFAEIGNLEVVKEVVPSDAPGLFNLHIDASELATDVGDGGTTGSAIVGAGTTVTPGEYHAVKETAGTDTSLVSYESSISCVDRGLTTFDGGPPLTMDGNGPLDVFVEPSDDIVCTITNTSVCATAICENSACATFACDPTGGPGNCDVVTYTPGEVCRAGSGDLCDPDELCIDQQAECPADVIAGTNTVCNAGSGDLCDPAEMCTGVAQAACPDDTFATAGTICNPGSGDLCDPEEVCSGNPDEACPDDSIADAGTVCNPGSGDLCDPEEVCSGNADEACPADNIASSETVCREGSGDACDPDEFCSGNADEACPADVIAGAGTICNPGSGDLCDPDELCSGVAGDACPDDTFDDGTMVCNPGSGDLCDPDETCPGTADGACPADTIADAGTVCDQGSGDLCDPDEVCSGIADDSCPSDTVSDQGTLCRTGSGDICDADEFCTGVAEEACPDDDAPDNAGNLCRTGNGVDVCDQDELCTGTPGAACPDDDALNNAGLVCRVSGTGYEDCDPAEVCIGQPGSVCPDDYIEPEGTACGDHSTTQCTDPDTCNDSGICLNNNKVCGSVTNSSLCEFDVEPAKGTCNGGSENGEACYIADACGQGGGICDTDICVGGTGDGLACTPPAEDACVLGGGICEQSDQFRLLFSPDVKNWVAYQLNASNPGQTFYNLMYDASGAGDNDVKLTITIPYPYVTVGGMPLHIYDGEAVAGNGMGCLDPQGGIRSEPMFITLDDWIFGNPGGGAYNLTCDTVPGPAGSGFCSFEVDIANHEIPLGGLIYVNIHLDYGLKGKFVDANPYGNDPGTGQPADRYDRHPFISPWGSSDALVNTDTDDGPLALADCQAYWFDHTDDVMAGVCVGGADDGFECVVGGDDCAEGSCVATPLFEDAVENLNTFNKISGLSGRAFCADDDSGLEYYLRLVHPKRGVVQTVQADANGYFVFSYKHKGKTTAYAIEIASDAGFTDIVSEAEVSLGSSGWYDVSFSATDCAGTPVWDATATYGEPSSKKGGGKH